MDEITGVASKGPVKFAIVRVFGVNPSTGSVGALIGQSTTDGEGRFRVALTEIPDVAVLRVTGGLYRSEATGQEVPLDVGDELRAACVLTGPRAARTVAITPLTHFAASLVEVRPGGFRADAVHTANAEIGNYFGLDDIIGVLPFDVTRAGAAAGASEAAAGYSLLLAGFSRLAEELRTSSHPNLLDPFDLIGAFTTDLADGAFDGMQPGGSGGSAAVALGHGSLPADAGSTRLAQAVIAFAADATRNFSQVSLPGGIKNTLESNTGLLATANTIVITPATPLLATGMQVAMSAAAFDAEDAPVPNLVFAWRSADPSIAFIDVSGALTARAQGVTTVSAVAGGVTGKAEVVVLPPVNALPEVLVTTIAPLEVVPGEVLIVLAEGLNPFAPGANEVLFASETGDETSPWLAVAGTAALNGDFDGRELRVVVPEGAKSGDVVLRATYLFASEIVRKASVGRAISVLDAAAAQERVPVLTNRSPETGAVGVTVTLTGNNFLSGIRVLLRDVLDPAQTVIVPSAAVTLRSGAELSFAFPAGLDAGDLVEFQVENTNAHSSAFLDRTFALTAPPLPEAPVLENLAKVRIVARFARIEDSGGAVSTSASVSVTDTSTSPESPVQGAAVSLTADNGAVLTLLELAPNTQPGVYSSPSFTYVAGRAYRLAVTGVGGAFRFADSLIAPGGVVVVAADGSTVSWSVEGNRDTLTIFRASLAGAAHTLEGPVIDGVADVTSPIALSASQYGFGGGASTGAFVVRVALASQIAPNTAAGGSLFEITNRIDRAITR